MHDPAEAFDHADQRPRAAGPRVLIVEDEANTAAMLTTGLRFLGFDPTAVSTGLDALAACAAHLPDVLLLDVMLPDMDGFSVCRDLRAKGLDVPVLFVTARDAVQDKIRGLELGGDGYVTKPFDLNEMAARINALLRRGRDPLVADRILRIGWVELDPDSPQVRRHGRPVELSATEFALLRYLLENSGQALTKAQILAAVWNYDFQGKSNVVETYVYYLRRKLGDTDQSLIRTVRGVGYLVPAARLG